MWVLEWFNAPRNLCQSLRGMRILSKWMMFSSSLRMSYASKHRADFIAKNRLHLSCTTMRDIHPFPDFTITKGKGSPGEGLNRFDTCRKQMQLWPSASLAGWGADGLADWRRVWCRHSRSNEYARAAGSAPVLHLRWVLLSFSLAQPWKEAIICNRLLTSLLSSSFLFKNAS